MNRHERRASAAQARKNKSKQPNRQSHNIEPTGDGAWDSLNQLYQSCLGMAAQPANVMLLTQNQEAVARIDNPGALLEQMKILDKDVKEFNRQLREIYDKHANRSGNSQSPDELMLTIRLGEEYQTWQNRYNQVVMPTVETILNMFDTDDEAPAKEGLEGEFIPGNQQQ